MIDMGFALNYSANPKITGLAGMLHIKLWSVDISSALKYIGDPKNRVSFRGAYVGYTQRLEGLCWIYPVDSKPYICVRRS